MKAYGNFNIVNICLAPDFLAELDAWAKKTDQNRSRFIREAVRQYIAILKKEGYENTSK